MSDILPEGAEFSATQAGLEVDGGPVGEPKPATPLVAVFAVIITALIAVALVLSFKLKDAISLSVRDVDAYLDKA